MKIYLYTSFLFILFALYAINVSGQLPLNWQDLKTGETQEAVYIPPPSIFSEGIRTATFEITYTGFTPEAQSSFQFAADIWSSLLNSEVPVKVNTYFIPLVPGLLGITLPNGRKDFSGAPQSNIWYSSSLANSIAGTELNAGEFDFDLYLNSSINWYFGVDGNCPAGKYDLVSIVLHEMCHGLGFVGLGKLTGDTGSFGLLEASDFAPIVTSFPWPELDTLPSIFDSKLEETNGEFLTSFENPSTELGNQFTGNQIYFGGENAVLMNDGVKPKMYAPSTFSLGSSLLHLNESTYPAGNINELMTPFAGPSNAVHDPGPIVMGILKDIGWNVNYTVGIENITVSNESIYLYPNPVNDKLWIAGNNLVPKIEIFDALGKCLLKLNEIPLSLNVSSFSNGIYFIKIESKTSSECFKFLKN